MFELTLIVAVIAGVVQSFKKFVSSDYMPFVSMGLGILAGIGFIEGSIQEQLFVGIALGLSASGAFDITKVTSKKVRDNKAKNTIK